MLTKMNISLITWILLGLLAVSNASSSACKYVFSRNITTFFADSPETESLLGLEGNIFVQYNNKKPEPGTNRNPYIRFDNLKRLTFNGKEGQSEVFSKVDSPIFKSFFDEFCLLQKHDNDYAIETLEDEPDWITNIKKSVGHLFVHSSDMVKNMFMEPRIVKETTIYGVCNVTYFARKDDTKLILTRFVDPESCFDADRFIVANTASKICRKTKEKNHWQTINKRVYTFEEDSLYPKNIETVSEIEIKQLNEFGSRQIVRVEQLFELDTILDSYEPHVSSEALERRTESIIITKPKFGENQYVGEDSVKNAMWYFDGIVTYLWKMPIDFQTPLSKKDQNINLFLKTVRTFSTDSFQTLYENIKMKLHNGTYKYKKSLEVFFRLLPHIGSRSSILFIQQVLLSESIKNDVYTDLFMLYPAGINLREPSIDLLDEIKQMRELPERIDPMIRNASILVYATIANKVFKHELNYRMRLTEFENYFYEKLKSSDTSEKSLWLTALRNLGSDRIFKPVMDGTLELTDDLNILVVKMMVDQEEYKQAMELSWRLINKPKEEYYGHGSATAIPLEALMIYARNANLIQLQQLHNFLLQTRESNPRLLYEYASMLSKIYAQPEPLCGRDETIWHFAKQIPKEFYEESYYWNIGEFYDKELGVGIRTFASGDGAGLEVIYDNQFYERFVNFELMPWEDMGIIEMQGQAVLRVSTVFSSGDIFKLIQNLALTVYTLQEEQFIPTEFGISVDTGFNVLALIDANFNFDDFENESFDFSGIKFWLNIGYGTQFFNPFSFETQGVQTTFTQNIFISYRYIIHFGYSPFTVEIEKDTPDFSGVSGYRSVRTKQVFARPGDRNEGYPYKEVMYLNQNQNPSNGIHIDGFEFYSNSTCKSKEFDLSSIITSILSTNSIEAKDDMGLLKKILLKLDQTCTSVTYINPLDNFLKNAVLKLSNSNISFAIESPTSANLFNWTIHWSNDESLNSTIVETELKFLNQKAEKICAKLTKQIENGQEIGKISFSPECITENTINLIDYKAETVNYSTVLTFDQNRKSIYTIETPKTVLDYFREITKLTTMKNYTVNIHANKLTVKGFNEAVLQLWHNGVITARPDMKVEENDVERGNYLIELLYPIHEKDVGHIIVKNDKQTFMFNDFKGFEMPSLLNFVLASDFTILMKSTIWPDKCNWRSQIQCTANECSSYYNLNRTAIDKSVDWNMVYERKQGNEKFLKFYVGSLGGNGHDLMKIKLETPNEEITASPKMDKYGKYNMEVLDMMVEDLMHRNEAPVSDQNIKIFTVNEEQGERLFWLIADECFGVSFNGTVASITTD